MKPLNALAFILLAGTTSASIGQTYTASKIVFNNPGPYSQAQLESVVAMHHGTSFTADGLGLAAQRLVDTGFFFNVGATLAGDVTKAQVLFDIKPVDRSMMLHVGFENFVWLTHAEIEDLLRARSPLFLDYLPENSPLVDTFAGAISDALAAKDIPATISHVTVEPTMLHPERVLEFRIAKPVIHVANVKLAGVTTDLTPLVQQSVNAAARNPYNDGLAGQTTQDRILAPLFDAGYIQASLSGVSVAPTMADGTASVVLNATLSSGDIYRVSGIEFPGSPLLSAEAFAATAKLHVGDVASRALLFQTLAPLDAAYRRQGYMDVIVEARPKADAATRQVAYSVSVKPGEQYRIHDITADHLDPAASDAFDRSFQMKQGDLYNPEYVTEYLKYKTAPEGLKEYAATFKAYANPNNHTVDLVLSFARAAMR
jgi:outer membrane protein assembly factor BamA